MQLHHRLSTIIHVIKASVTEHANDLIAVGGDHSVDVLHVSTDSGFRLLASFNIGLPITAVAWSNKSVSPSSRSDWSIELAVAGNDRRLYLLNKEIDSEESIFPFGGGLSGHRDRINSMSFCGGQGADSTRYVATVADDKMLMIWDLYPTSSCDISPSRPQPTAYVIPFSYPLSSIAAHHSSEKEFLVADSRGSVFVIDWRSDLDDKNEPVFRHSCVVELVDTHTIFRSVLGKPVQGVTCVAWCGDSAELIGATYGSRLSFWNLSRLQGGTPSVTIDTFPHGVRQFRWSNTHPSYFAFLDFSSTEGAVIHVCNIECVDAKKATIYFPQPHTIQDFDFLVVHGKLLIAAATGYIVRIVTIC